jgi:putative DNA primase/helicase
LSQWLEERCTKGSSLFETSAALFADWKSWAEQAGEFTGSQKKFSHALEERGFVKGRESGTGRMGFEGIGLDAGASPV